MLAMALPRQLRPWHVVVAKSCWQWHCRVLLVM
jgi:hypothetical protein